MAAILAGLKAERRQPSEVRGIQAGPSSHGSTYWGRVMHCWREHLLANELKWRSIAPDDALDLGTIWHWALEAYYDVRYYSQQAFLREMRVPIPHNLEMWDAFCAWAPMEFWRAGEKGAQQAMFSVFKPFADEKGYADIYDAVLRMAEVYLDAYRGDRWYILGVEPTLRLDEAKFGFPYSAKLDLVVVDGMRGGTYHIEHKSAYQLNLLVTEGYTQDTQVIGQVVCCRYDLDTTHLPPYCGGIVNITSKTKRPGVDRKLVSPPQGAIDEWLKAMRIQNKLRVMMAPELGYPKTYGSCGRRFGRCPFFYFCRDAHFVQAEELQAGYDLSPFGFVQGDLSVAGAEIAETEGR